jgi:hypothetical protein
MLKMGTSALKANGATAVSFDFSYPLLKIEMLVMLIGICNLDEI